MQKIIPAILTSDIKDLRQKLRVLEGNTQWVQIDVTSNTLPVSSLEHMPSAFDYEIHLMVDDPIASLAACQAVGAKRVIFYAEHETSAQRVFEEMQNYSFERGLALNPETSLERAKKFRQHIDSLLFLSVHPGLQGQDFIPSVLEKVRAARMFSPELFIGIDGGVNKTNVAQVFEAGADYAVVGSAIWKSKDPAAQLKKLEALVQ